MGNKRSAQLVSRRHPAYSVGLGRRRTSRDSEDIEDSWTSTGRENDVTTHYYF